MRSLLTACVLAAWAVAASPNIRAGEAPAIDPANMDTAVKPGVDFYQYANGGWIKKTPIPAAYPSWGSFQQLNDRNEETLHQILDQCAAPGATHPAGSLEQKLGDFYASGMDEAAINAQGFAPLQPELDRIAQVQDAHQLAEAIGFLQNEGIDVAFSLDAEQDQKDSTSQIAVFGQGGLGLPEPEYYVSQEDRFVKIRAAYQEHISKMLQLLGDSAAAAGEEAKGVMDLETQLAKASKSPADLRDPLANYNLLKLDDFEKQASEFDFEGFFKALRVPSSKVPSVDVGQPAFFTAFSKLVHDTPLPVWKSYLRWHLITDTAPYLSQPFVDENFRFFKQTLTGVKENLPRWRRVLHAVDSGLGEVLGQLYVQKVFPPSSKARALKMVGDLKESLHTRIVEADWMEQKTKQAALGKLAAMGVKIGYPDKWRDYSGLEIKKQPYVRNVLDAAVFNQKFNLNHIGQPVDPTEWGMSPQTVNAYYNPNRNEIVFPAAILQPPFFFAKADDAVNYGGIGAVIGHEMTHGFDDQGRLYDAKGNLKNWWTPSDETRFKEHGQRIVDQFNAYIPIDNLHINGQLTEGENIADLGGVRIAFAALAKDLSRKKKESVPAKIDGFTQEQRFFLSFAQVWQENIRPEALRLSLQVDPHSPAHYRVIGPLSNLPEFAKAFHVTPPAPMIRPADKRVQIW